MIIYPILLIIFIATGILLSNWVNQNYIFGLGVGQTVTTTSLSDSQVAQGFLRTCLKTIDFGSRVISWSSVIIIPIFALLALVFFLIKKIFIK